MELGTAQSSDRPRQTSNEIGEQESTIAPLEPSHPAEVNIIFWRWRLLTISLPCQIGVQTFIITSLHVTNNPTVWLFIILLWTEHLHTNR
jgi:hypothetical protein